MRRALLLAVLVALTGCTAAGTQATDNPWEKDPVAVYIGPDDASTAERDFARAELEHWEQNSSEYVNDTAVRFEVVDDPEDADLLVYLYDYVSCSSAWSDSNPNSDYVIGCARTQTWDDSMSEATIKVEMGYNESVTRSTLRHEMGHVFGLNHSDADEHPFMSETINTDSAA